jgi:hypothetical protein
MTSTCPRRAREGWRQLKLDVTTVSDQAAIDEGFRIIHLFISYDRSYRPGEKCSGSDVKFRMA